MSRTSGNGRSRLRDAITGHRRLRLDLHVATKLGGRAADGQSLDLWQGDFATATAFLIRVDVDLARRSLYLQRRVGASFAI